jgi:hypothetical protein
MKAKPKRRWISFRLSTLLAVVLVCCLVANWIREQHQIVLERSTMRTIVTSSGGQVSTALNPFAVPGGGLGRMRRLLGDSEVGYFFRLGNLSRAEVDRLKRAFPEAETTMDSPWRIGAINVAATPGAK